MPHQALSGFHEFILRTGPARSKGYSILSVVAGGVWGW